MSPYRLVCLVVLGFNGPLRQYLSPYRLVCLVVLGFNGPLRQYLSPYRLVCLVVLGFNGPLRQYLSPYRALSKREEERGEKGQARVKMSKQPNPHLLQAQ